ncbi:MAG: glycosyltransferase [Chloroflexi bacterium]|nr:glycosyltransferase [Chloroflexota bacterium]
MPALTPHPLRDLSIIIVNWNVADLLRACLRSIEANRGGLDLEVIVVDSASSDDSVAMVQTEFPWVTLLACEQNVGFPRGNNLGLAQANGQLPPAAQSRHRCGRRRPG